MSLVAGGGAWEGGLVLDLREAVCAVRFFDFVCVCMHGCAAREGALEGHARAARGARARGTLGGRAAREASVGRSARRLGDEGRAHWGA